MYTKLYVLYTVLFFFNSGGSVDDVLVRLSLVVQIIKDANLMCISFIVKHSDSLGIVNEFVQFVCIPI